MKAEAIIKETIRLMRSSQRQDIRKGYIETKDAIVLLGLSKNLFFEAVKNPDYGIIKSDVTGKYIYSSIVRAFKKIHGTSYKEAIEV